jgi:cobalt/nickel transport system permease protein
VGAGHAHPLYLPGTSPLHRARPQCKIAATLLFVLAVVATPREAFWAFGLYALALAGLAGVGRVPPGLLARRLVIELPFLLFAVFLPVVGHGPRVEVLGVSLAVGGLWAAWNIVVKGTLGVAASAILRLAPYVLFGAVGGAVADTRTEGWIAGLQLAALSMRGSANDCCPMAPRWPC